MRKVILLAGTMVLGSTCLNVTSIIGEDEAPMSGRWIKKGGRPDGDCGECLNISINQGIRAFRVESNQIYVSAYFVLDKKRKRLSLFFTEAADVVEVDYGSGPTGEFEAENDDGIIVVITPDKCR